MTLFYAVHGVLELLVRKGGILTFSREEFTKIWDSLLKIEFRGFFSSMPLREGDRISAAMGFTPGELHKFFKGHECSLTPIGIVLAAQEHFKWAKGSQVLKEDCNDPQNCYTLNVPLLFVLLKKMDEEIKRWGLRQSRENKVSDVILTT
jgi:hypothetical protein